VEFDHDKGFNQTVLQDFNNATGGYTKDGVVNWRNRMNNGYSNGNGNGNGGSSSNGELSAEEVGNLEYCVLKDYLRAQLYRTYETIGELFTDRRGVAAQYTQSKNSQLYLEKTRKSKSN
jgi:hypothetical protein